MIQTSPSIDPSSNHPRMSEVVEEQKKAEQPPEKKATNWNSRSIMLMVGSAAAVVAIGILIVEVAVLIHEIVREKIWRSNPEELEKKLMKNFSPDFINKLKALSAHGLDEVRLFKRLSVSEEDEKKIISYLEENFDISPEQLKEILMGAHVRLDDGGQTYTDWLQEVENKQSRISSHASDKTQYGVRGSLIKELLFSSIKEQNSDGNTKTYTWFQLENHPVSFGHIIRHMLDYIKYKITSQNQGPYGSSDATDRSPIILKPKVKEKDNKIAAQAE